MAQRGLLKPFVWSMLDVQVHGKENLRSLDGGFVVVANHSSHLDTPLIMGSLPTRLSRYLAAGAAADYFFKNWWKAAPTALFFNAFPVERTGLRNRRGLAGGLLSDGVPLLLFPEGTRSRTGNMAPFKPGAAALCISRNVPCLPVAIVGARDAMPTGRGLPKPGRPTVHIVFGSPMYARPDETAHRFSERIAKVVRGMHDQIAKVTGYPTLADYARIAAESEAAKRRAAEEKARRDASRAEERAQRDKELRERAQKVAEDTFKPFRDVAERARAATKRDRPDADGTEETGPEETGPEETRPEETGPEETSTAAGASEAELDDAPIDLNHPTPEEAPVKQSDQPSIGESQE